MCGGSDGEKLSRNDRKGDGVRHFHAKNCPSRAELSEPEGLRVCVDDVGCLGT